jgi:hypothetical protein
MRHGNLEILLKLVCSSLRKVLNLHQEREFLKRGTFLKHISVTYCTDMFKAWRKQTKIKI